MPTIDEAVASYVRLRDKKKALQDEHKEQLKPYNTAMEKLENWMLAKLNQDNAQSVRTDSGTVFKSMRTSASVQDWEATLGFIRENELYHLLERRVSKTAVEEMAEQGQDVPGVQITREITVNIRRK